MHSLLCAVAAALPFTVAVPGVAGAQSAAPLSPPAFADLVARLSEPSGYFDTDNLISNEGSYLHAVSGLEQRGVKGGAYVGVGPDQNFSYMARIRPEIAFLVDIRRDNLLEHLLFKALFAAARNRIEYLCLLTGKAFPMDAGWESRSIEELVRYIDGAATDSGLVASREAAVRAAALGFGLPLSAQDLSTIASFHRVFVNQGLGLKMTSFNRPIRADYPDYRRLLLERDRTGRQTNYLANEVDFRFLKSLQERNLVVPVVGNLAGTHAIKAIGAEIARRGLQVSAYYTSNVEFYIFDDGSWPQYTANVAALPRTPKSVIIRSYFPYGRPHPDAVAGYNSVQLLQSIDGFVRGQARGEYRTYWEMVGGGEK